MYMHLVETVTGIQFDLHGTTESEFLCMGAIIADATQPTHVTIVGTVPSGTGQYLELPLPYFVPGTSLPEPLSFGSCS